MSQGDQPTPPQPRRRTGRVIFLLVYSIALTALLIHQYRNSWTPSGDRYARFLIEASDNGRKIVQIGDPAVVKQRVCFFPPKSGAPLRDVERFFPNLPILLVGADDSNLWYAAMHAIDQIGVIVLAMSHKTLSWEYEERLFTGRSDPEIRIVCPSAVNIRYFKGHEKAYFWPVYEGAWPAQ